VRFIQVWDVEKLNRALNNGLFGHHMVWINVAHFSRFRGVGKVWEIGRKGQGSMCLRENKSC
jgi:hypothetical protein